MIDHYRSLFAANEWLETALSWIVVRPLGEPTTDDLLRRLNGGRDPERRVMEDPREEASMEDRPVLLVFEGEGVWGFLEFCYGYPTPGHILTELSANARLWMTTWHFNGGWTILYAEDGEIRASMRDFVFVDFAIEDGDPSVLAGFRAMLDDLGGEDYRGKRSAAFAFIEAATGMGVESDEVDVVDAPVIVLDRSDA
ncbi:hypothetical protein [Nonomuraea sp. NPDC002799]